jgi:hypothetical protein
MERPSTYGVSIESGSILRYDGKHVYDPLRDESVTMLVAPFLTLRPKSDQTQELDGSHFSKTLLQFLYDYEVSDDRDAKQIVRKESQSRLTDIFHVSHLFCLRLGTSKCHSPYSGNEFYG